MSTKTYQNISRRLVSIPCNSGEYRHIPAGAQLEIAEVEVKGNAMVEKLLKRGVLMEAKVKAASTDKPGTASKRTKAKSGRAA